MSMLANYVQVSPDELAAFHDDPSSVGELFHEAPTAPFARLLTSPETRARMEQLAPQLLAGAVAGLDPRFQEELAKRMNVTREALSQPEGGAAILELMKRRGLVPDRPDETEAQPERNGRRRFSLDKAWHGLHYLLDGEADLMGDTTGSAVIGGTDLGDDDFGYGPARYFDAQRVAEIDAELGRTGLEDELRGRYDAARMTALGVYPGGWERPDQLDWLLDGFRDLREFFHEAAEQEQAVVTCLV